jgi:hypothetical protein
MLTIMNAGIILPPAPPDFQEKRRDEKKGIDRGCRQPSGGRICADKNGGN